MAKHGGQRLAQGDVLLGRFRIAACVGEGGMGSVYRAHHLALEMPVAIKVIRAQVAPEMAAAMQARFIREARALARIRSEYVCRPLDFGVLESGEPYLVLEHLEGDTLANLAPRLSIERAIDFALQAAAGLAEAHRFGLCHRDVKPSNIFITAAQGGRQVAKVLDFGLAKALEVDTVITKGGEILGTPEFMSPEQVTSAQDVDARADVWSLGVVLYWLLSGMMPFHATTRMRLLARILHEEPDYAAPVWSSFPGLQQAVSACLKKDPNARLQNVAAVADALWPFASFEGRFAASIAKATLNTQPPPKAAAEEFRTPPVPRRAPK